jgi:PAS domain S-box-containing protein
VKQISNYKITLNSFFAVSYFLLAALGLEWGTFTTNASLLWAPSGLAVFGLIVFGRSILAGLFIGAFLSSQLISLTDPASNNFLNLSIAAISGSASVLQALLIATFSRRYYERQFHVSTTASITFAFMVVASCGIAATISGITLWQTNIINLTTALQTWAVWWIGDAIGILIITPLLLWIYHRKIFQKNSQAHAFFIFCAGIGIVLLTVAAVGHSARETLSKTSSSNAVNFQSNMQTHADLATSNPSTLQEYLGADWQLLTNPQNIAMWFLPNLQQVIILIIGFAGMILLSAYLQALYRQDQLIIENQTRLEEEISNQTQALRVANDWLLKEIEEKHITQEQLKASEAHMRTLLDNIPDPIWFKSPEGNYLSVNKAVTTLFHRSENDVTGKKAGDYIDSDLETAIHDFENAVLASQDAVRRELWIHIPERNQKRLMDTIKVAVRDSNKEPIGILSIARDITEQHQLIDELEKFKRFAEYASEGFSIMTLKAETLYMNRSLQKMLLSNQSLPHNNFLHYLPQDLHSQWHEHILPFLLLKGYWQGELAALRIDGSRLPTKHTFFIMRDEKGQPLYIGEVMSDISEQKQVEASLQLAKKTAEEATLAKSRFLANMSHEIRTPLNAVLGYSQLLMTDTQLSAQQHERMSAILNAGQRLLHLINDILDLSKIEAGALHFREDYFDLRQELNDILALMHTKATTKGLVLSYDLQLPNPAIIKTDRQKIGQIILNLLGNAIKFTANGEVQLNAQLDSAGIVFTITDTGPGISESELQQLFTAFKQGKSGEESGGTGLGLVISKHITESLGGELTLDSELGKGTRAHLRLPFAIEYNAKADANPQIVHAKLTEDSHCKVLVVEDDFASRDLLVNLLRHMGCNVIIALDGAEGLEKAISQTPDIIFTDIRMPNLSGTEMLKELRRTIAKEELPVVAVSASSLEHERTFYLGEGFHEFIGKPYQFRDIYSALKKFTQVEFVTTENITTEENQTDKHDWNNHQELRVLQEQLLILKANFSNGDMNNSKRLFALQNAQTLGAHAYQKIQNAIRQYDLVLAEKFLDELLEEMSNALKTGVNE